MAYSPTAKDLAILKNHNKTIDFKVQVLNGSYKPIDEIQGEMVSGSMATNVEENNRRKLSLQVHPKDKSYNIREDAKIWFNRFVKMYIGLTYVRDKSVTWYSLGIFSYDSIFTTYESTSNTLSLECSDLMSTLNGTKNGELSALVTTIPAGSIIRDSFISVLTQLGGVDTNTCVIPDMGTYYGTIGTDAEITAYRLANPTWNQVPYDLVFSSSDTVFTMLEKILNLYSGWEMFFDEDGIFHVQMIPTGDGDAIVLNSETLFYLQANATRTSDLTFVRNIVHIWGKEIECDRYSESVTNVGVQYNVVLDAYTSYFTGDKIAIKVNVNNGANPTVKFNSLAVCNIYDQATSTFITANTMLAGQTYVLEYTGGIFYLLGQYQVEALVVLCNTEPSATVKAQYLAKYNCVNVKYVVNAESPYSVEKLGQLLSSKSGDDYDNITSNSLAICRGEYDLYTLTTMRDTASFNCIAIPWLMNGNQKIQGKVSTNEDFIYLTKQIALDFSSFLMDMSVSRFYPTYPTIIGN